VILHTFWSISISFPLSHIGKATPERAAARERPAGGGNATLMDANNPQTQQKKNPD